MSDEKIGQSDHGDAKNGGTQETTPSVSLPTPVATERKEEDSQRCAQQSAAHSQPSSRLWDLWELFHQRLKRVGFHDWVMLLATIAIAVSTIFYTVYSRKQLETMSRTLEEMQRSGQGATTQANQVIGNVNWLAQEMNYSVQQSQRALNASIEVSRTDQRAWVGVIEAGALPDVREGSRMSVTVVTINSGKTPALRVTQVAKWRIVSNTVRLDMEREVAGGETNQQGVIQPGGRRVLSSNILDLGLTKAQADAILAKTATAFIFGRISYWDIFKREHWTKFCMHLQVPPEAPGLAPCDTYNEAN